MKWWQNNDAELGILTLGNYKDGAGTFEDNFAEAKHFAFFMVYVLLNT